MKGVVFNLLEEAVTTAYGEDTWDTLLASASLHGAYTSLGSYPDSELLALVDAASGKLNLPPADIVRWFGRKALPLLATRYPKFFAPHRSSRSFVLTLNDIIHPEVRKIYPQASVPDFAFDTSDPKGLKLIYSSPKKLCHFAEGLIEGTADHYGETVSISQSECMHQGDARCVIVCSFAK
jgi:hypothetical protein